MNLARSLYPVEPVNTARAILAIGAILALVASSSARAEANEAECADAKVSKDSTLRVDVEVDPLAYALSGHSVHVGVGFGHFRFDLGAFALEFPEWVHGNEGFTSSFDGFGIKAHIFVEGDGTGPFAGVAGGLARTLIQNDASGRAQRDLHASLGVELGWLLPIVEGLYVKPWIGVGWTFGVEDVVLDRQRFEANGLTVFPTVHLGYAF